MIEALLVDGLIVAAMQLRFYYIYMVYSDVYLNNRFLQYFNITFHETVHFLFFTFFILENLNRKPRVNSWRFSTTLFFQHFF